MATKEKKTNFKAAGVTFIIMSVFMMLFGVVMMISSMDYIVNGGKNIRDVIDGEGLKSGQYVKAEVNLCLGGYATKQHKINGIIPAGKEQSYLVALDYDTVISVTVKGNKKYKLMDDLCDDTIAMLSGTGNMPKTITIEGEVQNLEAKQKDFYSQTISGLGLNTLSNVYYLDIDTTMSRLNVALICLFLFGIGVALFVCGIVYIKKAKLEAAGKLNVSAGVNAGYVPNAGYGANNAYDANVGYGANNAYNANAGYGAGNENNDFNNQQ